MSGGTWGWTRILAGHMASPAPGAEYLAVLPTGSHVPAVLPDPLASPEGGSGHDAALRANLKMKRGGSPPPDGALAALLGPDPGQRSAGRTSGGK